MPATDFIDTSWLKSKEKLSLGSLMFKNNMNKIILESGWDFQTYKILPIPFSANIDTPLASHQKISKNPFC